MFFFFNKSCDVRIFVVYVPYHVGSTVWTFLQIFKTHKIVSVRPHAMSFVEFSTDKRLPARNVRTNAIKTTIRSNVLTRFKYGFPIAIKFRLYPRGV